MLKYWDYLTGSLLEVEFEILYPYCLLLGLLRQLLQLRVAGQNVPCVHQHNCLKAHMHAILQRSSAHSRLAKYIRARCLKPARQTWKGKHAHLLHLVLQASIARKAFRHEVTIQIVLQLCFLGPGFHDRFCNGGSESLRERAGLRSR